MPFLTLPHSPNSPGQPPARLHYRDQGAGPAVLVLHGGWGHEVYPYDAAAAALASTHRVVVPDRIGYGASDRLPDLLDGFHRRMAEETVLTLDALGIRQAALWGHSDGAVVAAWTALLYPGRVRALVLEALHYVAAKVSSVEFFRTGAEAPERFGEAVVRALVRDHGRDDWRAVVGSGARAWLRIIEAGRRGLPDLYEGRFGELRAPTLLLHGRRDPRTEPGELEAARAALPAAELALVDAGHSPHTGSSAAAAAVEAARRFLEAHRGAA